MGSCSRRGDAASAFGPLLIAHLRQTSGSYRSGFHVIAVIMVASIVLPLIVHPPAREGGSATKQPLDRLRGLQPRRIRRRLGSHGNRIARVYRSPDYRDGSQFYRQRSAGEREAAGSGRSRHLDRESEVQSTGSWANYKRSLPRRVLHSSFPMGRLLPSWPALNPVGLSSRRSLQVENAGLTAGLACFRRFA